LTNKARLVKGFRDIDAAEARGTRDMMATLRQVYELYGFDPIEQPIIEYTDALGKFLPDVDRPNEGVFSFQDDDDQWVSLRYDLTAPLARYVAENLQNIPTPFRSYRQGLVFRNENTGAGRFRQFMQFDADTVGSSSPNADAEMCMLACDAMEALGIERGQYIVKVNSRKTMDSLLSAIGLSTMYDVEKRLTVLRAIDKLDRLGLEGVQQLLGEGRKDESGDFTTGAGLNHSAISRITAYLTAKSLSDNLETIANLEQVIVVDAANDGLAELRAISDLVSKSGYDTDRIVIDPSVVRGLEYYTGPVFECELLMETKDDAGNSVRFGSAGGGGRYDSLIERFTGQQVPSTGFSVGVSRLYSALKLSGKFSTTVEPGPVIVLVMDKDRYSDYWNLVQKLRKYGISAEMYIGTSGVKAQMKYADRRNAPFVIIQGSEEKAKGEVQIKDLRLGAELASSIETREEYASQRLAQISITEEDLVVTIKRMLFT
jgi:histidyl-tRNA synthetase